MMTSIGGQQEMVIDNDGPEINDNDKPVIEPNMDENKASKDKTKQSQQSPPPKWTGAPDCQRISTPTCTFSPSMQQVKCFVLDTDPPARTILPYTIVDPDKRYKTNTTEDHILKPSTRSVARANSFTIPDSVPLSESDEDEVGVDSRKVYVIPLPYRACKPPFVKKIDSSEPINLDLYAPANQEHLATSSQVHFLTSPSPSTLFPPGQPGVRVKRSKRLNRIAKASPAPVVTREV